MADAIVCSHVALFSSNLNPLTAVQTCKRHNSANRLSGPLLFDLRCVSVLITIDLIVIESVVSCSRKLILATLCYYFS